ncbi:MAG: methyltransferase domain-containing protein [Deltaproteobacteria bacterium]|nr:MAG: methyltransferase domain-containing protein [Deltaproteobacteria bacterium]
MSPLFYRLSPQLVLCSRKDPYEPGPQEEALFLETGAAFPLGHPTTRLCLELLKEALATGEVKSLLDVGCGTGVLALAAAALGTPRVTGVDLSLDAARVTLENARANHLAGRVHAARGSTECLKGPFDLVAANLPWEVQMDKAPELNRLAGPGGRLLLSGFRENQEEPLLTAYRKLGRSLAQRLIKPFHHPELPPDLSFTWVAWLLR